MKKISILICGILLAGVVFAQDEMNFEEQTNQRLSILEEKSSTNKLQFSGYIQFDTKYTQGLEKELDTWNYDIRRARLKSVYSAPYGKATLELNIAPFSIASSSTPSKFSGVSLKNAFIQSYIPGYEYISLTAGIFDRPFGYELSYSSSTMETAERSMSCQALLPGEQDLGAKITLSGVPGTFLSRFTLDAGLFAGNGLAVDAPASVNSNKKHFIGRLAYKQNFELFSLSAGVSYYNGDYVVNGDFSSTRGALAFWNDDAKKYVTDSTVNSTKREYFGVDIQLFAHTEIGSTTVRAELYTGQQPTAGGWGNWRSNADGTINNNATNRVYNFTGWYVLLAQDIWTTPHSIVLRYDMFNPNTKIKSNDIKNNYDLNRTALSLGYMYRASANLRISLCYDIINNEKTSKIDGIDITTNKYEVANDYSKDRRDNVLTLRLQYKF